MKISVIIPVYNLQNEIAACLDSIYSQDFDKREYEILVVLDSVTDNSETVVRQWHAAHSDVNLKLLYTQCKSAGGARNLGLDNALGEYIVFVDGDDYLINNSAFSIIYSAVQGHNAVRMTTHETSDPRGDFSQRLTMWLHVFSRRLIGETRFCEYLLINEDFDFVKKVRSKPDYDEAQVNIPLYFYNFDYERMIERIKNVFKISCERKMQGLPPVYVNDEFNPDRKT